MLLILLELVNSSIILEESIMDNLLVLFASTWWLSLGFPSFSSNGEGRFLLFALDLKVSKYK